MTIDKYDDLGGPTFPNIKDPRLEAKAYLFQKKVFMAAADLDITPPNGTAIILKSQHRQIGKTACLTALVNGGRAVMVTGVDEKSDKKKVSEMLKPCDDGETVFQLRHVYVSNLEASDKKIDQWPLYSSIESYTDGKLGGNPENGRWYFMMTNDRLKCGEGEVGENLSATRVNFYEIVGVGNPYDDPSLGVRYEDYDIVPDTMMHDQMLAKGKAKFEVADASKKASESKVDTDVYVFFQTFETLLGPTMMAGKDMARILQSKHECFNSFLSGKTQQFEKDKFHKWLKTHGQLLTPPGVNPAKYKLSVGGLGEMTIIHKNSSGTPKYNLKLRTT